MYITIYKLADNGCNVVVVIVARFLTNFRDMKKRRCRKKKRCKFFLPLPSLLRLYTDKKDSKFFLRHKEIQRDRVIYDYRHPHIKEKFAHFLIH